MAMSEVDLRPSSRGARYPPPAAHVIPPHLSGGHLNLIPSRSHQNLPLPPSLHHPPSSPSSLFRSAAARRRFAPPAQISEPSPPPSDSAMGSGSPSSPLDSSPPSANPLQALPLSLPTPANPPQQGASSSRRLPPPCWSHEETIALIDSYREKWYSLRRGNLKANHWQDVADSVSHRCPNASPPKTAVQCRHKMEKLRKRYRTELQRARSMPISRFTSSWVHFKRMDAMEKGPSAKPEDSDSAGDAEDDDEGDDDDQELYEEFMNAGASASRSVRKLYGNGVTSGSNGSGGSNGDGAGGFRIRIPTGVSIAQPGLKNYAKSEPKLNPNSNPSPGLNSGVSFGTRVVRESNSTRPTGKRGERERERDPVAEMVSAIKALGDGFVRMERMKMEMAREIESMRMEMEMKRTEMILESQQRIVEAFAEAVSENKKKPKRIPSPES